MRLTNKSIPILSVMLLSGISQAADSTVLSANRPANLLSSFASLAEQGEMMKKVEDFLTSKFLIAGKRGTARYSRMQESPGMRSMKADLFVDGIPVHGGTVAIHKPDFGNESFSSELPLTLPATLKPKVSRSEAIKIASLYSMNPLRKDAELRLLPSSDQKKIDLVWWVDFRSTGVGSPGSEIVINAMTGKVIGEISQMHSAASLKVYNAKESGPVIAIVQKRKKAGPTDPTNPTPPAPPSTTPAGPIDPASLSCVLLEKGADGKWNQTHKTMAECTKILKGEDPIGAQACQVINYSNGSFYNINPENCELYSNNGTVVGSQDTSGENATSNSAKVYEYYKTRFNRLSFDGNDSDLRSVVKVGMGFENAAWLADMNFMVYGFGDHKETNDFSEAADVAGHEMTHGVVNSTAKLTMMDEPGAVNEGTADYFGLQIAGKKEWIIGKGIFVAKPTEGLRSLENPSIYTLKYKDAAGKVVEGPFPDKYSQKYTIAATAECGADNDRCFVHGNSTIISHAYYMIDQAIGNEQAQDLIYRALIHYYNPNTGFKTAGVALRQACTDLFGTTAPATCDQVDAVLKQSEI